MIHMNKKAKYLKIILLVIGTIYLLLTFIMPDVKFLGKGYVYHGDARIIYKPKTSYSIEPSVIDYKFNRNYIIIMQKLPKYQNVIYKQVDYPDSSDSVYFYVIEKQTDLIFGPFDSIMFNDCIEKHQVGLTF